MFRTVLRNVGRQNAAFWRLTVLSGVTIIQPMDCNIQFIYTHVHTQVFFKLLIQSRVSRVRSLARLTGFIDFCMLVLLVSSGFFGFFSTLRNNSSWTDHVKLSLGVNVCMSALQKSSKTACAFCVLISKQ